jgi:hypothetical protein
MFNMKISGEEGAEYSRQKVGLTRLQIMRPEVREGEEEGGETIEFLGLPLKKSRQLCVPTVTGGPG